MAEHIKLTGRQGVRAICVRIAYCDFLETLERYLDEARLDESLIEAKLFDRLLCQTDALEAAVAEIEILAGQKEKK